MGAVRAWVVVAPPRGERGLKYHSHVELSLADCSRSPSWGAWIEIQDFTPTELMPYVAPPRGERGLKYSYAQEHGIDTRRSPSWGAWIEIYFTIKNEPLSNGSLPLVGSVD